MLAEKIQYGFDGLPFTYEHLSGITLVVTYIVTLIGAYTSAIGAGLACPDWPTCYGTWIPFLQSNVVANSPYSALQIFAEWAHRGLAMITGFLIMGTVVGVWSVYRNNSVVKWSGTMALLLLPLQVLLGRLTVTQSLKPIIVTTYLGIAILLLLCLQTTFLTSWISTNKG